MARAVMTAFCHDLFRGETVKPNLIVILVDDLRFDETGASGHPYFQTPHIDRLTAAARGNGANPSSSSTRTSRPGRGSSA
jgi:hypothetical protein